MPSTMTHAYIAKDIYKKLDIKIKSKITTTNLNEMLMFSSGFDVLYFYKMILMPFNRINKLGNKAHNSKINAFFINLINQIKKSKNMDQFMYLAGLIAHYVADSTIHPYVTFKANGMKKKHFTERDGHFQIEAYLDNYFINKYEKGDYRKFKIHDELFKVERNQDIVDLLNKAFKDVFQEDNIGEYYYKAVVDMRNFFKIFRYDSMGLKRKVYNVINIFASLFFRDIRYLSYNFPLDNDEFYLNLKHEEWYNLKDISIKSRESLLELYDRVVKKGLMMTEEVYDYIFENKNVDLEKLFGNKSYGDGIVLK